MNPLVTTALASTGQKIIEHCLSSPESKKSSDGTFDGVLDQKLHNDFDVPQYLREQGLNTVEEVVQHVKELKALLVENRDFSKTALPHLPPNNATVVRSAEGFSVACNGSNIPVEMGTESYSIAKSIHHLESWLQNQ